MEEELETGGEKREEGIGERRVGKVEEEEVEEEVEEKKEEAKAETLCIVF